MKKFYSLALAAAVAAGSLSASAQQFASKLETATVADTPVASVSKSTKITASYLKEHGTLSQRADRNLVGDYFLSCSMSNGSEYFEPFTIEAGTEANKYVIKGFFFGDEAAPLQAEYVAGTINDQFYEFLVIPGNQKWFMNSGYQCNIFCGYTSATGFGTYTDGQGGYADMEFVLEEEDGDLIWTGEWANTGQTPAIAWVFVEGPNKDRGNAFLQPAIYLSNAVFTGNNVVGEDEDTQQYQFEEVTAPAYVAAYRQAGKNFLEITGISTTQYTTNPLYLSVAENGEATATDCVAGSYYTDASHTATYDAYYWNGEPTDTEAIAHATLTEADGTSTITFAENALYIATNRSGAWRWMEAWAAPKVVINRTFGYVAGVENIAADVEDLNAPVEYYNLQGIRVAQPEAGQLLIQRQGNKATKVVIR